MKEDGCVSGGLKIARVSSNTSRTKSVKSCISHMMYMSCLETSTINTNVPISEYHFQVSLFKLIH